MSDLPMWKRIYDGLDILSAFEIVETQFDPINRTEPLLSCPAKASQAYLGILLTGSIPEEDAEALRELGWIGEMEGSAWLIYNHGMSAHR